ncbi:MAG: ANTAR domain-containing protein [Gaiellaceae bacterium]
MSATRQTSPEPKLDLLEALRRENDQLRTALETRIVIEQAKGLLAERLQTSVDDAFERLRREARNRRMKLHGLAAAAVAGEPWTKTIFPRDAEGDLVERHG